MNKQGEKGISYINYSWNPISGCLHGCGYCYAEKIAKRFGGHWDEEELRTRYGDGKIHELEKTMFMHTSGKNRTKPVHSIIASYPFGFDPTFHRYRLDEPQKVKQPSVIGVVYMGDLFGDWVPDEWIQEVFAACEKAPQHTYMFLTKNPYRYLQLHIQGKLPQCKNFWYGTTLTGQGNLPFNCLDFKQNFISLEPLLGDVSDKFPFTNVHWVILGEQTNPAKPPKDEWIQSITDQCKAAGVPLFIKSPLYERFPIQQWPEGLRR